MADMPATAFDIELPRLIEAEYWKYHCDFGGCARAALGYLTAQVSGQAGRCR